MFVGGGRLQDVQQVLHGGRHFVHVRFLDQGVLRAFGDFLEVWVLDQESIVFEVDQEREGVVRFSLGRERSAGLRDAASAAVWRSDRGRRRGNARAFIEQLRVVEVLGDDQTGAVLGELDDPALVEEYPTSNFSLHVDAPELDDVSFDQHRRDLQEEAVSLSVVVDELHRLLLLQHLLGLEDQVDLRCNEFVSHRFLFICWFAESSPPRDEFQPIALKEIE